MIKIAVIDILWISLACIGAYLIGSVPMSVWIGKLFLGIDIRDFNTKNPGGMNAVRTFGLKIGFIVMFLDFLKGTLVIGLIDQLFSLNHFVNAAGSNIIHTVLCIVGPALCVLGHAYPLFLQFKGGQGIGVFIGTLFYVNPIVLLFWLLAFIVLSAATKLNVRATSVILVLTCIPILLFLPLGPPWSNIFTDIVLGPGDFIYLTPALVIFATDMALLVKLAENLVKKSKVGTQRGPETG